MNNNFAVLSVAVVNGQCLGHTHVHAQRVFVVQNTTSGHVFVVAAAVFSNWDDEGSHVEWNVVSTSFSASNGVELNEENTDENVEADAAVAFVTEQMASHL